MVCRSCEKRHGWGCSSSSSEASSPWQEAPGDTDSQEGWARDRRIWRRQQRRRQERWRGHGLEATQQQERRCHGAASSSDLRPGAGFHHYRSSLGAQLLKSYTHLDCGRGTSMCVLLQFQKLFA